MLGEMPAAADRSSGQSIRETCRGLAVTMTGNKHKTSSELEKLVQMTTCDLPGDVVVNGRFK